jgi:hypothetical protein
MTKTKYKQSHHASTTSHVVVLMANPCSAPDNSSACNQSFLYIRSTERSAAAKCVTAIATKSVAVGRNDRHIPSSYSCHIHSLHSCQDHPAGLWSTADASGRRSRGGQDQADQGRSERGVLCTRVIEDAEMRRSSLSRVCCLEAVGRSFALANRAGSRFASDRRSGLKEGRVAMRAPVLPFLTANRVAGSRRSSAPSFTQGRVAMRAAVQPSISGMDPGGRRPTVLRTLVDSDRSRRVSAGAQVLYTVLVEGERGCSMGTQASKLPRRSRSASRVVVGVLGAVAREVVGDRCAGVLCALGQSRSTHGQSFERGAQRPAGVVGVAGGWKVLTGPDDLLDFSHSSPPSGFGRTGGVLFYGGLADNHRGLHRLAERLSSGTSSVRPGGPGQRAGQLQSVAAGSDFGGRQRPRCRRPTGSGRGASWPAEPAQRSGWAWREPASSSGMVQGIGLDRRSQVAAVAVSGQANNAAGDRDLFGVAGLPAAVDSGSTGQHRRCGRNDHARHGLGAGDRDGRSVEGATTDRDGLLGQPDSSAKTPRAARGVSAPDQQEGLRPRRDTGQLRARPEEVTPTPTDQNLGTTTHSCRQANNAAGDRDLFGVAGLPAAVDSGSTGQHRRCGRNDPSHPSRANRRQRTAPGFAEGAVGKTGNGQAHAEGALSASFLTVLSGLFLDQDSLFLDGCLGRCKSTALQLAQRKTSVATGRGEADRRAQAEGCQQLLKKGHGGVHERRQSVILDRRSCTP